MEIERSDLFTSFDKCYFIFDEIYIVLVTVGDGYRQGLSPFDRIHRYGSHVQYEICSIELGRDVQGAQSHV